MLVHLQDGTTHEFLDGSTLLDIEDTLYPDAPIKEIRVNGKKLKETEPIDYDCTLEVVMMTKDEEAEANRSLNRFTWKMLFLFCIAFILLFGGVFHLIYHFATR